MKKEDITLSLLGDEVETIRFDELNSVLHAYQHMLDCSYLAYKNKNRAGYFSKNNFHVSFKKISPGSILVELAIHARELLQTSLEIGININSITPISSLIASTVDFYKVVSCIKNQTGKNPDIRSIRNEGDKNFINTGDLNVTRDLYINVNGVQIIHQRKDSVDETCKKISDANNKKSTDKNINPEIYIDGVLKNSADMNKKHVYEICKTVQKSEKLKEIKSFSNSDKESSIMSITRNDAYMIHPITELDSRKEQMVVKIFKFDTSSGIGRLRVIESESVPTQKNLSFECYRRLYDKIINALHASVEQSTITTTKNIVCYPSGKKIISRLYIESIN